MSSPSAIVDVAEDERNTAPSLTVQDFSVGHGLSDDPTVSLGLASLAPKWHSGPRSTP